MLKTIMISYSYTNSDWTAIAEPPVAPDDPLILFFNNDESRSCQISFEFPDAFGILGLALAPTTGFVLTFRGVASGFSITDAPVFLKGDSTPVYSGTIPPGY